MVLIGLDRKSTRLNSSHTVIYTLSLHDALPICVYKAVYRQCLDRFIPFIVTVISIVAFNLLDGFNWLRSEEHTSELQSHRDLHSFPTRRSSDLCLQGGLPTMS